MDQTRAERTPPLLRAALVVLGSISVALGVIGIFLPVMPSTVFFLIAAACYVRSSDRLYQRLLSHPRIGPPLRTYREQRAMPLRAKVIALAMGWTAIGTSAAFALETLPQRAGIMALGIVMTAAILRTRTLRS